MPVSRILTEDYAIVLSSEINPPSSRKMLKTQDALKGVKTFQPAGRLTELGK